jgi:hypothetical protein
VLVAVTFPSGTDLSAQAATACLPQMISRGDELPMNFVSFRTLFLVNFVERRKAEVQLPRTRFLGTGVKIAMAAAHFHGFGVARQGSWTTWVNNASTPL